MFEAITLTLLHTCSQSVHVMQHALLDQTIYVHKAIAFARRIIDYDLTYLKNGARSSAPIGSTSLCGNWARMFKGRCGSIDWNSHRVLIYSATDSQDHTIKTSTNMMAVHVYSWNGGELLKPPRCNIFCDGLWIDKATSNWRQNNMHIACCRVYRTWNQRLHVSITLSPLQTTMCTCYGILLRQHQVRKAGGGRWGKEYIMLAYLEMMRRPKMDLASQVETVKATGNTVVAALSYLLAVW